MTEIILSDKYYTQLLNRKGNQCRPICEIECDILEMQRLTGIEKCRVKGVDKEFEIIKIVKDEDCGGYWDPLSGEIGISPTYVENRGEFRIILFHEIIHAINDPHPRMRNCPVDAQYLYNEFIAHTKTMREQGLDYHNNMMRCGSKISIIICISKKVNQDEWSIEGLQKRELKAFVQSEPITATGIMNHLLSPSDLPKLIAELNEYGTEQDLSEHVGKVNFILCELGAISIFRELSSLLKKADECLDNSLDEGTVNSIEDCSNTKLMFSTLPRNGHVRLRDLTQYQNGSDR